MALTGDGFVRIKSLDYLSDSPACTPLQCNSYHCTALYCSVKYCTLHCTELLCITVNHCTATQTTPKHCITVQSVPLQLPFVLHFFFGKSCTAVIVTHVTELISANEFYWTCTTVAFSNTSLQPICTKFYLDTVH